MQLVEPNKKQYELYRSLRIQYLYNNDNIEPSLLKRKEEKGTLNEFESFIVSNYTNNPFKFLKEDFKKYCLWTTETKMENAGSWYHGTILRDGTICLCSDMGHRELYEKLSLIDECTGDWMYDSYNMKFTYEEFMGDVPQSLQSIKEFGIDDKFNTSSVKPTLAQMKSVIKYGKKFRGLYGESRSNSMVDLIRNYIVEEERNGTKYGNLKFLEYFYLNNKGLDFKLPKTCKIKKDSKLVFKNSFIRTSPLKSLPGLLNSVKAKQENLDEVLEKMKSDFDFYNTSKSRFDRNYLGIFEQEFVTGITGVASIINGEFSYGVSDKENDVVSGKTKDISIDDKLLNKLKNFCEVLYGDLDKNIQIEFVFKSNTLYIVQLRILENLFSERHNKTYSEDEILISGKSFSQGYIEYGKWDNLTSEVKKEDILIVSDDCDSKLLTSNIQLLIVENDVSFSHILALSTVRKIKSIYGTGKIDLDKIPESFRVDSMGKIGYILKIKEI